MISRMSYVTCDECTSPGEMADDAKEARALAHRQGFRVVDGRDLCPRCRGVKPRCSCPCGKGTDPGCEVHP